MRKLSLLRRGSPGQAMVLGAVALLCLTLGVLATLNLGQAVHEKIKLQNTADAAAYSLATMEARTFNYIAFTNRVQITHYHTAMVVQSYVSYAGYSMAIMGTAVDILRGVYHAQRDWCSKPYPINLPFCPTLAVITFASTAFDALLTGLSALYKALHYAAKTFVEAMGLYNRDAIHRRIQTWKAAQLNIHLLTGMQEFVKINDKQLEWFDYSNPFNPLLNIAANTFEYWNAFDKSAGMNPAVPSLLFGTMDLAKYKMDASGDAVKEAQSIMAELANATRANKDVYDRSGTGFAITGFSMVTGGKMGQTRMIGKDSNIDPKPKIQAIRDQGHYGKCTGDRLASDDFIDRATGMGWSLAPVFAMMTPVTTIGDGIRTDADGGKHYKYKDFSMPGYQGPREIIVMPPPNAGPSPTSRTFETESNEHKFPGKNATDWLAPYFKFKPYPGFVSDTKSEREPDGPRLKTSDYNQPSTWMYLNKKPDQLKVGRNDDEPPWKMKFSMNGPARGNYVRTHDGTNNDLKFVAKGGGGTTTKLDTTIGGERQAFADFMQGLNVISRGQVYYHRPDDWREHPNFFNPFWRARLAPIAQVLTNLWERLVGNNLVPSAEAGLLQQIIQNFINNALADIFLRTVTGLITH